MIPKKVYVRIAVWDGGRLFDLKEVSERPIDCTDYKQYHCREYTDLSQVWHPATEEPQKYPILCQDEFGNVWVQQTLKDYVNWKEFEELECATRWAYIDDLLPKGGEK